MATTKVTTADFAEVVLNSKTPVLFGQSGVVHAEQLAQSWKRYLMSTVKN
jgi:hypothetical protein